MQALPFFFAVTPMYLSPYHGLSPRPMSISPLVRLWEASFLESNLLYVKSSFLRLQHRIPLSIAFHINFLLLLNYFCCHFFLVVNPLLIDDTNISPPIFPFSPIRYILKSRATEFATSLLCADHSIPTLDLDGPEDAPRPASTQ